MSKSPFPKHTLSATRNVTVDCLRTLAILLMVIFHFIYDLKSFGYVAWDIPDGTGWREFRYLILTLFFVCVGIGLVYAHGRGVRWRNFWRREAQVLGGAGLVTAMSLVMFPENWIYFGVLHFIFVASVLALPLVWTPRLALLGALILMVGYKLQWWHSHWPFHYAYAAWPEVMPGYANDWVPLIPWLALVWAGIFLAHSRWLKRDPLGFIAMPAWLAWPGKHSLLIYLLHQPVMVAGFYLLQWASH